MWDNKSAVDKFEKLPRADRMLLLYFRDFNTKPRPWWKYPDELRDTTFWRQYQRFCKGLDPSTGRANIEPSLN